VQRKTLLERANPGNTYSLEGSEESVSDDLSASRRGEETDCLVLGSLGTEEPLVNILEHLVETELSEALARVTKESGVPSLKIL
jgi:hypothetical protein